MLGDALGVSDTQLKGRRRGSLFKLTKAIYALHKHLGTLTNYLKLYGKWACETYGGNLGVRE